MQSGSAAVRLNRVDAVCAKADDTLETLYKSAENARDVLRHQVQHVHGLRSKINTMLNGDTGMAIAADGIPRANSFASIVDEFHELLTEMTTTLGAIDALVGGENSFGKLATR